MKQRQSKLVLFLGLALATATVFLVPHPSPIQAQGVGNFGLTVTPPVTYLTLRPGETVQYPITLKYDGGSPVVVTPSMVHFNPAESGQGIDLEKTHSFPYLDPTQPNPFQQAVTLEPGMQTSFTIPISVPASATTHEYHLTVLFATNSTLVPQSGLNQAQVSGTIGSNLIILVSPDNRDLSQLSIKSIQGSKLIDSFGKIDLRVVATNTGPTATTASGSASLRDSRGNIVQKYQIYPDVLLANSSRQLRVVDPDGPPIDLKASGTDAPQPLDSFTYDQPFLVGPYTLSVELLDTTGATRTSATDTIWALPIAIGIIILLSFMLLGGYFFLVKKVPLAKRLKTY